MMLEFFILGYFQTAIACCSFIVNNMSLNRYLFMFTSKINSKWLGSIQKNLSKDLEYFLLSIWNRITEGSCQYFRKKYTKIAQIIIIHYSSIKEFLLPWLSTNHSWIMRDSMGKE